MRKNYLKNLYKIINLNSSTKKRLLSELNNEIEERENAGERIEDIIQSFGDINELAIEFEEAYPEEKIVFQRRKKIINMTLIIIAIIMLLLALHNVVSFVVPQLSIPYIATAYSGGNTLNFIAFKMSNSGILIKIVIEIILSVISFVIVMRNTKKL